MHAAIAGSELTVIDGGAWEPGRNRSRDREVRSLVYAAYVGLAEETRAVLARDLNRCIAAGGNIYFLAKLGATHGKSFQQMAGSMTGMTEEEYRDMMISGGRSAEGNRVVGEDGSAQAHRQPQGSGTRSGL